jgi:hypothetical protein
MQQDPLDHPLLIVDLFNAVLGPVFEPIKNVFGYSTEAGGAVVPNYMVISLLIVAGFTLLGLLIRSRLSVEQPGRFQIVLEDLV